MVWLLAVGCVGQTTGGDKVMAVVIISVINSHKILLTYIPRGIRMADVGQTCQQYHY